MKLKYSRVKNFRSVNDSGLIEVGQRTALVGRNESGKTNLLLALASLNPPDGMTEMTFVKDFPRDRMPSEFSEVAIFLDTTWELAEDERRELARILPRAKNVRMVEVSRRHKPRRTVAFVALPALAVDTQVVSEELQGARSTLYL